MSCFANTSIFPYFDLSSGQLRELSNVCCFQKIEKPEGMRSFIVELRAKKTKKKAVISKQNLFD